ncbi:MAG: putative deacylase [Chlamydiales bacterium]|jgi:predicted deacylase
MRTTESRPPSTERDGHTRVLGSYGSMPGPLLVLLAGIHGNEPAGVIAARRVFESLQQRRPAMRGRVVAITGNLQALASGVRYIDDDLNRLWTAEHLARITRPDARNEAHEQRAIIEVLLSELEQRPEDVTLLDLHTTSALGSPFTIISDTLRNRRIAFPLKVPVILGLEENLEGTLLDFLGNYGCATVGLEGGQHNAPATAGNHEAAIWITLARAGLVSESDIPELEAFRLRLDRAAEGQPTVVDIQHREDIEPGDDFAMLPGFENFQSVSAGELLAHTGPADGPERREVRTASAGMVIMPRYQGQGSDGFFIGRRIRPIWVRLSGLLRRLRLSRVVAWLPGISKRTGESDFLEVDRQIAALCPSDVFHLFGYRRMSEDKDLLVFTRRVERMPDLERLIADFRQILQ